MAPPTTPVTTLQRALRDELRQPCPRGRVLVAVDGRDGSGTSTFAASCAPVLGQDGSAVFHASIVDNTHPAHPRRTFRDFC